MFGNNILFIRVFTVFYKFRAIQSRPVGHPKLGCLPAPEGTACSQHPQVCLALQPLGSLDNLPNLDHTFAVIPVYLLQFMLPSSTSSFLWDLSPKLGLQVATLSSPKVSYRYVSSILTQFPCKKTRALPDPGRGHP